jgi:hypothetical protein
MIALRPSSLRRALRVAIVPALLVVLAADAEAQGKSKGNGQQGDAKVAAAPAAPGAKAKGTPPGQAKKKVTHAEATDVSRQVLVAQGYTVTRVERVGGTQVLYYYRGNNGRGKGRGPLQRMIVRPSADRYVFEGVPRSVIDAVKSRLGL